MTNFNIDNINDAAGATNPDVVHTWATTIVVATDGHVWVAKSITFDGHFYHLHNTRTIRRWGTTKGLNELVQGPTSETILDAPAPLLTVVPVAMIALIPCSDGMWPNW